MKLKHIVFWRLKDNVESKQKIAEKIKADLEALNGKIPNLFSLIVGIDISMTEQSSDVVLIAEFPNKQALKEYAVHPLHVACIDFIRNNTQERRVVDFEF